MVKVVRTVIRESNRVYRYGGEEFLVLLPQTELYGAKILAQRILDNLKEQNIPHCKSSFNTVTASCGIAYYSKEVLEEACDWEQVVKQADDALYVAKSDGRDRLSAFQK